MYVQIRSCTANLTITIAPKYDVAKIWILRCVLRSIRPRQVPYDEWMLVHDRALVSSDRIPALGVPFKTRLGSSIKMFRRYLIDRYRQVQAPAPTFPARTPQGAHHSARQSHVMNQIDRPSRFEMWFAINTPKRSALS